MQKRISLKGIDLIRHYCNVNKIYHTTSEKEVTNCLEQDLKLIYRFLKNKLKVKVTQAQFDALCAHTYRTNGSVGLMELINNNDINSCEIEFWWKNKFVTKYTKCIANDEYNLFKTGELKFTDEFISKNI